MTRKHHDNGLAITDTQHSLIEALGLEFEKEKMFNWLQNCRDAQNPSEDMLDLINT